MKSSVWRRFLSLSLAFATVLAGSAVPALSSDTGTLSGRVTASDGLTPRKGVVVALVDPDSRTVLRSAPTNDDGSFRIADAPAGGYKLLAETDDGAFLADGDLQLAAGDNRPLALQLSPGQTAPTATIAPGQASDGTSWWQWLIAGTIAVAGLLVVSDASDETNASPTN